MEVDRPVSGLAASLSAGAATVRQLGPPFEAYTSSVDERFIRQARDKGGLLFGITHLVNPGTPPVSTGQIEMLMRTRTILMGWWISLRR